MKFLGRESGRTAQATTKQAGDAAEARALAHLAAAGLRLVQRNYRTPGRGGGEVDLVMREADGTLVFVEVRARASRAFGGAAASVGAAKRRRIVFAARHFLLRLPAPPPCRFDVVAVDGPRIDWLRAAFDAG
ncbi:YraN family protein [Ramlibacter sp. MAHUQ-53]|uniref:YraN family protein n=1 Tax=unclassified Ramlibacter TaxID=2617605 RepID=UPI00363E6247